jgi:hypothetical protein
MEFHFVATTEPSAHRDPLEMAKSDASQSLFYRRIGPKTPRRSANATPPKTQESPPERAFSEWS